MSPQDAVREMLSIFKAVWDDQGYTAIYTDVAGSKPTVQEPWARVTVRHNDGGQKTLGDQSTKRVFTDTGTIFIQVFAPQGAGHVSSRSLAHLVRTAYCQTGGGSVWYRNQRLKEIGGDGAFDNTNVLIDFTYDDLR